MTHSREGGFLAVAAFVLWGAFPLYFKALAHVAPLEVLANRVIWSAFSLFVLVVVLKYWNRLLPIFRDSRQMLSLLAATLLIATNWGVYIWSVTNDYILEASLGYYINPLFNVFLGYLLLHEKLRKLQWLAVGIAAIGVGIQIVILGKIPWIALILAASFGLYGFIHKKITVNAISGLFIETILLFPIALIFLSVLSADKLGPLVWTFNDWLLLMATGPVTIIPLLLFTAAAKRINYSTLGFFQYIAPSILFLLALFYYKEPFSLSTLLTFILIWLALIIFTIDSLHYKKYKYKYVCQ